MRNAAREMSKPNPHILKMVIFNNQSHFSSTAETSPRSEITIRFVRGWEKHSKTLTDQHLVWPCAYFGKTVLQLTEWLGSDKYDEISSNNYKRVAGAEILTNNRSNVEQIIICAMLQENIVGASVGSPNWGDPATNKSPLTGSHHEIHRYRRLSS